MTIYHKLLPKHGEQITIDYNTADRRVKEIIKLQQRASLNLSDLLSIAMTNGKDVTWSCRQCMLDVALQFHDLSELIKELASDKSS